MHVNRTVLNYIKSELIRSERLFSAKKVKPPYCVESLAAITNTNHLYLDRGKPFPSRNWRKPNFRLIFTSLPDKELQKTLSLKKTFV